MIISVYITIPSFYIQILCSSSDLYPAPCVFDIILEVVDTSIPKMNLCEIVCFHHITITNNTKTRGSISQLKEFFKVKHYDNQTVQRFIDQCMFKKLNLYDANNIIYNFHIILASLAKYFAIFPTKQWAQTTGHFSQKVSKKF